eukprot:TRINITY_DN2291_c0_g1_i1.p1 TRINITY_DN2291_c0_g1~~TRINITY_DN2291_c0_g1_i1.p1  ORF type:complete len:507 (+),score=155.62 TRINITY_DN2291_c0_g1_i1:1483-3003(+)
MTRLSIEGDFLLLLQYIEQFYQNKKDSKRAAFIAVRQLDYLYYKRETADGIEEIKLPLDDLDPEPAADDLEEIDTVIEEDVDEAEDKQVIELTPPKSVQPYTSVVKTISRLCALVYQHCSEDRQKRLVILQQIYHLAIHDRFYEARDMLLMTHVQERIHKAKASYQVMFNRVMVQLGLAAFRKGRIEDANNCLQEIVQGGKVKELLAQGINTRYQVEKTNEQEKLEKRRQIPYHMHINLELIECVQLISAMLLEVPNMAQSKNRDVKRKIISKHFRKMLDYHDRQVFSGPPENSRESVIAAAKELERGDWKHATELVLNLDIWELISNADHVKKLIARQIQEQALRTYVFAYGHFFQSLLVSNLAPIFELEEGSIHAILSKMIISEEICASFDQPSGAFIIHGQELTSLQSAALTYAEKAISLVESSDTMDPKYDRRWLEQRAQKSSNFQQRGARFGAYPRSERQFTQRSDRSRKQPPASSQAPTALGPQTQRPNNTKLVGRFDSY